MVADYGRRLAVATTLVPALVLAASACGSSAASRSSSGAGGVIHVVAAENEYGNVAAQVGGTYVSVKSIESDPNTDPHSYEVSTEVAKDVAGADVVIRNGLGYDDFVTKLEGASPRGSRRTIDVQQLLGLPDSTSNPHLWYSPGTMPTVAEAIASTLATDQPGHAAYFHAQASGFIASLQTWTDAIAGFKASYGGTAVATTEPVADYLLDALGLDNLTPFTFQADVMNGVDPAPQDVAFEKGLLSGTKAKVLVYNEQVTDSLTQSFITTAGRDHVPVVGVYETMPTSGYTYQSWMMAEVTAIQEAITAGVSTQRL